VINGFHDRIFGSAQILREPGNQHERAIAMNERVKAQAQAGNLAESLSTVDMVFEDQHQVLYYIGKAMMKLANCHRVRSALHDYLSRASRAEVIAWHSCAVLAHFYPDQSNELGNFLIALFRQNDPGKLPILLDAP